MQAKKSERRRRILLLADFAYASGKAVASGVMRFASAHSGLDLLVHGHTSEMPNTGEHLIPSANIDGIVSCFGNDMDFMQGFLSSLPRTPIVFASVGLSVASAAGRRSAAVFCDQASVANAAAELLVRHGLSEFGYVGARYKKAACTWDLERREAFIAYLSARGFHPAVYTAHDGDDADAEMESLSAWLRGLPKPCGLFVSNDIRAVHVLNACRAEGISVPGQVQVVGVDNEEWVCCHTSPTLTSVELDFEGCGRRAAETLVAMMDGRKYARRSSFGVSRVVQRMSTTDMHGNVNRALRAREWLQANCCRRIDGIDCAAALGCSTRTLQMSYKSVFGRSMRQDVIEMRLDHAQKLLVDTDIPVCRIPERCGVEATSHFMRMFKARTGMTMLQYRRAKCG